jgi:hypothetical protein
MKLSSAVFVALMPCTPAPPGKSTIAASHPLESMEFLLKYLPVAVAEDNGTGDYGHGATQGRVQTVIDGSYSAPNCQLYSAAGSASAKSGYESMTANGVGSACSYKSGKSYGTESMMWKVYANNKAQCCNACVSTDGCAAATFETSNSDHSGGMGPQSWEGFGIHLPDVDAAKTTGGLSVDELMEKYDARLSDFSKFDAFMDYSVTFYVYDLQHYVDMFNADSVPHFLGQWTGSGAQWYSLIFKVPKSTYVLELVSQMKPSGASDLPEMEQRMSDAHCTKFSSYEDTPAKTLEISSINRAASDMKTIDDVHTNLYKGTTTFSLDGDVTRRCYKYTNQLDEDICFTGRTSAAENDAIFSVADHEAMLWAVHAETLGSNPSSTTDKYTDSHYAQPISSAGLSALKAHFQQNDPYPITKDTRLAYACEQSYIIDPTGFCVQPIGRASWPNCGWDAEVV